MNRAMPAHWRGAAAIGRGRERRVAGRGAVAANEQGDIVVRMAELRAADVDRQAIADRLRMAVDEGRLDLAEYDQRLPQAYLARTYRELDALVADLPAHPSLAAATAGRPAWRVRWVCCLPIPVRQINTRV
jgi:hypothetical protein